MIGASDTFPQEGANLAYISRYYHEISYIITILLNNHFDLP